MADPTPGQPNDFQLRPVQTPPPAPPAAPGHSDVQPMNGTASVPPPQLDAGMSSNDIVIGIAIVAVLAVVFFFVRGGVRRHLISERASLSAASAAGWSMFAFLLSLAIMVVFGLVGNILRLATFVVPMALLVLATLILTIVTYRGATRRRR